MVQVVTGQQAIPGLEPSDTAWCCGVGIDAAPSFFGRVAGEVLVRAHGVVPEAKIGEQAAKRFVARKLDAVELLLEGAAHGEEIGSCSCSRARAMRADSPLSRACRA